MTQVIQRAGMGEKKENVRIKTQRPEVQELQLSMHPSVIKKGGETVAEL